MTQTYSAVVRPRVMASDGETRLLDDIVEELLRKGRPQQIIIKGTRGSGKTFAIQHIAERFAAEVTSGMIRLIDEPSLRGKSTETTDSTADNAPLLTLISARDHDCSNATVYQLAAWDQDDVIEFVLHRFPEQSSLLLNRTKDGAFLEGLPELWVLVLEELAANRLLPCVETAIWSILHRVYCNGTELSDAGQTAWDDFQSGKLFEQDSVEAAQPKSSKVRLRRLYPVQCLLAAEYFCSKLRTRGGTSILNAPIPEDLLPIIARRLRDNSTVMSDLAALLAPCSDATLHSSAVTLLLAIDSSWRPSNSMTRINLNRAVLDGAHWSEVDLSHATMNGTCGNEAKFHNCDLSNVQAGHASFRRSSFRHANL
ncbi:MAG: pentapeptide repeat-containing protein [Planctomycetaceae bacterium]|nr:pentapeptide repeat-containing protein [Planctomycetaceae bacterium]